MKGGLIQLVFKGHEDQMLISEPTFTFFKKVYKKHTNFSIDSNLKRIGKFKSKQLVNYKILKEGDLLGPMNLKIILPKYLKNTNEKIEYPDDIAIRLFKHIDLFINDERIETLNYDIFKLKYNFHMKNKKKQQFDKIIKLRDNGDNYTIYLPLLFYFYESPNLYIPIISLINSEIFLNMKLIELFDSNELIDIYIDKNLILLDNLEKEKFGSLNHEYLVEKYSIHNSISLNEDQVVNKLNFSGVIKNIYFISNKFNNDDQNTFDIIKKEYDVFYEEFLKLKEEYDEYIKNGSKEEELKDEFKIFIEIEENINLNNLEIINKILSNKYLSSNLSLEFLLYLLKKYTDFPKKSDNYYIGRLLLYYVNIHKNNDIIIKNPFIDKLKLKINNKSIFGRKDQLYYNLVTSYDKTNSNAELGYYFMTFSLYPEENNPSGHLNFQNVDESVLIIDCNPNILNIPVELKIITKEYNLMRIMSGLGSYIWKN